MLCCIPSLILLKNECRNTEFLKIGEEYEVMGEKNSLSEPEKANEGTELILI